MVNLLSFQGFVKHIATTSSTTRQYRQLFLVGSELIFKRLNYFHGKQYRRYLFKHKTYRLTPMALSIPALKGEVFLAFKDKFDLYILIHDVYYVAIHYQVETNMSAMINQELIIQVGDKGFYRSNAELKSGIGYVYNKDYPCVVKRHSSGETVVQFTGDDGNLHTSSVEYNSFNSGMSSFELELDADELRRRQDQVVQRLLDEANAKHQKEVERIKEIFQP